ncbi:DMT family transporter [Paenibacillus hodogayensis]|uniref:DMT family transporter n=1 Tax=Paenibacillus hodogayensis TaxID=279208 RepID=A0ABV5VX90_9BACL
MAPTSNRTAYTALLVYAGIIGFSFLFIKYALTVAAPMDILAHRFTISLAAALLAVAFGWMRLAIRLRDVLAVLPLALFYPALFFSFQMFGLSYTTSSEAGIVQATAPALTTIIAYFALGERPGLWQKLSVVLSMAGVIFMFVMSGARFEGNSTLGMALIAVSALALAGYGVLARKMSQRFRVADMTFMMSLIGFVTFNAISVVQHASAHTLSAYFLPFASPLFIMSILYLGIVASLVSSFLSNYSLSRLEAYKVSAFNNVSTLITIVAGVVLLKEQLEYYHFIGAVLIIAGVLGTNLLRTPDKGFKTKRAAAASGKAG